MIPRRCAVAVSLVLVLAGGAWAASPSQPKWAGTWQAGPTAGFTLARFDGAYDAGTGKVYFLGGRMADNSTAGNIWSFDPASGTYADTGQVMPIPISNYVVNPLRDAGGVLGFYTFCGRNSAGTQNFSVQVYDPATNSAFALTTPDDFPGTTTVTCSAAMNVVYNNKVYLAGGFDGTNMSAETWVFDPTAAVGSKWTRLTSADLTQSLAYIMGAAVDGKVYAIGGAWWDGSLLQNVNTVQVLDPAAATPSWSALAPLPEMCSSSRAWGFDSSSPLVDPTDNTPLAGKIISGCGVWSTPNANVYAYTVASNSWTTFPTLVGARRDQAAELLPLAGTPTLRMWGGYDATAVVTNTTEIYTLGWGALIFQDGFETGDTSAWSTTVP